MPYCVLKGKAWRAKSRANKAVRAEGAGLQLEAQGLASSRRSSSARKTRRSAPPPCPLVELYLAALAPVFGLFIPQVESQQLATQRRQCGGGAVLALPVAWIARKGIALGSPSVQPGVDPPLAGPLVVLLGRRHRHVLSQAGLVRGVGADAVGKLAVPDQQVAGVGGDGFDGETGQIGFVRIAVGRLGRDPGREFLGHTGNTLETALPRGGIAQAQNALDVEGQGIERCVDIPVNKTREFETRAVGHVEVAAVDAGPQCFGAPDIGEGPVDSGQLADRPHGGMVVEFDHARAVELYHAVLAFGLAVPGRGICGVHLLKSPDRIDEGLYHLGRSGVADDDITHLVEEEAICGAEYMHGVIGPGKVVRCPAPGAGVYRYE